MNDLIKAPLRRYKYNIIDPMLTSSTGSKCCADKTGNVVAYDMEEAREVASESFKRYHTDDPVGASLVYNQLTIEPCGWPENE